MDCLTWNKLRDAWAVFQSALPPDRHQELLLCSNTNSFASEGLFNMSTLYWVRLASKL